MVEQQAQIRNFKDFLTMYNRLTELCFNQCVDNLFTRTATPEEDQCMTNCVGKFTNVNHKIMGVYVEVQADINDKRVAEMEALAVKQQEAALELAKQQAPVEALQDLPATVEVDIPVAS